MSPSHALGAARPGLPRSAPVPFRSVWTRVVKHRRGGPAQRRIALVFVASGAAGILYDPMGPLVQGAAREGAACALCRPELGENGRILPDSFAPTRDGRSSEGQLQARCLPRRPAMAPTAESASGLAWVCNRTGLFGTADPAPLRPRVSRHGTARLHPARPGGSQPG